MYKENIKAIKQRKFKNNIIKIDFDYKFYYNVLYYRFAKLLYNLKKYKGIIVKKVDVKESKKGIHIILKLNKDIEPTESLFYAVLLGSDPTRETYNYCRYIANRNITYNFFAIKKTVGVNNNYKSYEKITKRSRKLKRKMIKIITNIDDYKINDGAYF